MRSIKLRHSEWLLIGFFSYTAALTPFFPDRPRLHAQPLFILLAAVIILVIAARAEMGRYGRVISMVRDWLPIPLTLTAFREMELFLPLRYNTAYEHAWIRWDGLLLNQCGFKHAVEAFGDLIPTYFELCYLLVYGLGTFCIIVLWYKNRRERVDQFYVVLLAGTLISYGLLPYFPSRPPRIVFPALAAPLTHNIFRRFNLFLLNNATIHSGVFPSAHVSSAFAAAWAMFLVLPERKPFGWAVLVYAASVAAATVYGRYHYAVDAVAGFGVSLVPAALALYAARNKSTHDIHSSGSRPDLLA
ncbi:MAG TPA: phosphatase PAP2 family protein [Bryobacteraceae bacterium]